MTSRSYFRGSSRSPSEPSSTTISVGRGRARLPLFHGLHHLFHSFFHFFCRRFRFVRPHHLRVAVGIDDGAAAITPKHVHHRTLRSCAELCGLFHDLVGVFHVDVQARRRCPNTLGAAATHLLALRRKHERRPTQREFSVNGLTVRTIHDSAFHEAEYLLIKARCRGNVRDGKGGRNSPVMLSV